MRLGILQTGWVPDGFAERYGEYPDIFDRFYNHKDPSVTVAGYPVVANEVPTDPYECDAWLVTGSKYGVYDDQPWIGPLKTFLLAIRAARVPLIGICFGHQIMAEAFGGRAEKSDKGWGCGVHDYSFDQRPAWLGAQGPGFSMHAMHQDQVTAIPEDATRLASSPFCEYAMLSYGDADAPDAISIQPHPEFNEDFARDLVELRAVSMIPKDVSDTAMKSFGQPVHGDAFVRWSLDFIRGALARKAA
ncbi:MAG: hypothetical protein AAGB15_04780 [Pseudomonadota bacterium]